MPQISAVIITLNEEKNIARCINSLRRVADEIVVVDSFSTDETEKICLDLNVRFIQHPFQGYRNQKNFAIQQAKSDIILSLDADEALSAQLEESIIKIKESFNFDAYKINRLNNYRGRWIYQTDWYPESYIRLFNRSKGLWVGDNVHERVGMIDGSNVGVLKGDILHWRYGSYEEQLEEINKYSTLSAKEYFKRGVKASLFKVITHSMWRFIHSYVFKLGFLAGFNGLIISILVAQQCFMKYAKLRALIKQTEAVSDYSNTQSMTAGEIRIGFDAKRAFHNKSGLGNYSRNLISTFTERYKNYSFYLFTPRSNNRYRVRNEKSIQVVKPYNILFRLFGSLWRSFFIVNHIKKYNLSLYHGLSNELPFGIDRIGVKSIVTVHDLIFIRYPEFFNKIDSFIYKKKIEYACKVADRIVAVSTQTKNDIVKFLKIDPSKIVVIPQGCSSVFDEKVYYSDFVIIKTKYNLPDQYILSVGTVEERKNLLTVIKSLHEANIRIPLVVVGRKTEYYYSSIMPYIDTNKITNVIFLDNVQNNELPAIYQHAEMLIYVSLYEGFGIPILEALTSGIPIITSKGGCFEETGGPCCIYINPLNVEEISDAVISLLVDDEPLDVRINQGFEHLQHFTPEVISARYINLYKSLINESLYENKWVFNGEKCHQAVLPC